MKPAKASPSADVAEDVKPKKAPKKPAKKRGRGQPRKVQHRPAWVAQQWQKYKEWKDAQEFIIDRTESVKMGKSQSARPMPYNLNEFAINYLGTTTWGGFKLRYKELGYAEVIEQICEDWRDRWILLAATGAANPLIASRILCLTDKQEVKHEGEVQVKEEKQISAEAAKALFDQWNSKI